MFRAIVLLFAVAASLPNVSFASEQPPVSCHLSFDAIDFLADDWIERTGLKTVEERKWETIDGRFGKALYFGAVPLKYDNDNMSGLDLDIVTAVIFNVAYAGSKGRGYDEPFLWGAGKLHPAKGAISFWTKGSSQPELVDARTILFEQTTTSWGRKERQLLEIELLRDRTITAYVEDARYVQHSLKTAPVWKDGEWNHIVFMWDRASGIALYVNGTEAASTMGKDAWWDNQRPGLFHFPMAKAAYDEFYIFSRPLDTNEIAALYASNTPPASSTGITNTYTPSSLLKKAFTTDTSSLPEARPSNGDALVFREITPDRIHDEGIQGWWIADGRYELAWPHEYSVFTIIPGDVDFHAEKADILPPEASMVNYLTFEGNLDGVTVLKGDRDGSFDTIPVVRVPQTTGFFYGTTVSGLGNSELRIPFTKSYGAPPGFGSDGDVLKLPQSGDLRLHEVGLFNVNTRKLPAKPGNRIMQVSSQPVSPDDARTKTALSALYADSDRNTAGLFETGDTCVSASIDIKPMGFMHLIGERAVGELAFDMVAFDLWIQSSTEGNVLRFRLLDPAVPSHIWSHAEMKLNGFTGKPAWLRVAMAFDPAFLVPGDRLWIELMATDGLTIIAGDADHRSTVTITPDIEWEKAEPRYALKTLRPNILTYGRSFEYIPWEWDKKMPYVDNPDNFGGMFDMAYPWQAVLKVNPGDRLANIYKAYATGTYTRGRWPADMDHLPEKTFDAPSNAPDWAVYYRELQTFRGRIVTWWRNHQRSDGQAGGGWNDDTLIFSRTFGDMPLDSNEDAMILFNKVFDGFEKTNYFKDGYCRIDPIDRLHNGDFVRERYKSLIYNIGDPRSAVWAMEEGWHWNKPDKTPINYGDGKGFLFGKDVMEWYWGRHIADKPYELKDKASLISTLKKAALANDEITLWRFTEAWCHTDDQSQYGAESLYNMLLGGWGSAPGRDKPDYANRNVLTVGIGWVKGGGPQLGRLVEYSGDDGLVVDIYSFDHFDREATARLYRIADGTYSVTLSADTDGDGSFEKTLNERKQDIRRFDTVTATVPPQTLVRLALKRLKAAKVPASMPDLAVCDRYLALNGDTLSATIYNIGCAPSGKFTVSVVCPRGEVLKTVTMNSISGSEDFVPKKATVTIPGLPPRSSYTLKIDSNDKVREIYEGNNAATIMTGTF